MWIPFFCSHPIHTPYTSCLQFQDDWQLTLGTKQSGEDENCQQTNMNVNINVTLFKEHEHVGGVGILLLVVQHHGFTPGLPLSSSRGTAEGFLIANPHLFLRLEGTEAGCHGNPKIKVINKLKCNCPNKCVCLPKFNFKKMSMNEYNTRGFSRFCNYFIALKECLQMIWWWVCFNVEL